MTIAIQSDKTTSGGPWMRYLAAALLVAGLQTAVLGYIIVGRAAILRNGAEVLLKTEPVDPRDLLRGDYVILNYDISNIPADKITGPIPAGGDQQVLSVRLTRQADGFWSVAESSFGDLDASSDSVLLKTQPFEHYGPVDPSSSLHVSYGIERYYVPEGDGKPLEDVRGTEALSVAVRVGKQGQAQIRTLLLDGKPAYEEPLY